MKITKRQLERIIKKNLVEVSWVSQGWDTLKDTASAGIDAARDGEIIDLLYNPIVDRINEFNYSDGVCDNYNCDGNDWADKITTQLKNHKLIEKANVSDIAWKLPGAIKLIVGGGQPKSGTVIADVMGILDQFSPETLVKEEVDLNSMFDQVLTVLQNHGLAEY